MVFKMNIQEAHEAIAHLDIHYRTIHNTAEERLTYQNSIQTLLKLVEEYNYLTHQLAEWKRVAKVKQETIDELRESAEVRNKMLEDLKNKLKNLKTE